MNEDFPEAVHYTPQPGRGAEIAAESKSAAVNDPPPYNPVTYPSRGANMSGASDLPEVVDPEVARIRDAQIRIQEERARLLRLQHLDEEEARLNQELVNRSGR